MNRNLASALTVATTAAVAVALAAIASGKAYADDITVDKTPFVSSKTRAEVQAELISTPQLVRAAAEEWSMQYNQLLPVKSAYTSEQAKAEFRVSRGYVSAITGEDSGSAFFIKSAVSPGANPAATMGGPAR
jgi:hypothetical protein